MGAFIEGFHGIGRGFKGAYIPSRHAVCFRPFLVGDSRGSRREWYDGRRERGPTNQSQLSSNHPII